MHQGAPRIRPGPSATARVVSGTTIGNMLGMTPAVAITLGTLLATIARDFGWSRTEVAGAFTAFSLAAAAMFPFAGRVADRIGTRPVLIAGFAMLGLAVMALGFAPRQHFVFYALFAISGMVGVFPSTMMLCKMLSEWIDEGRAFWMGLTSGIGNAVGASMMPIIATALMAVYGWRGAFIGIGTGVILIGVPVTWFLLRTPPRTAAGRTGIALEGLTVAETVQRPLFWLILSAVPIAGGALTAVLANTVPIAISRGLSMGQATMVVAAFAMVCSVWKPLVGFMLDRTLRPLVVAPFYVIAAVGVLGLAHIQTAWRLTAAGALAGVGMGAELSVMLYILSRYFGLRALGTIGGIAYTVVLCSNALVPIALNYVFDRFGSYAPALYAVAGVLAYNAIVFVFLKPYPTSFPCPAAESV